MQRPCPLCENSACLQPAEIKSEKIALFRPYTQYRIMRLFRPVLRPKCSLFKTHKDKPKLQGNGSDGSNVLPRLPFVEQENERMVQERTRRLELSPKAGIPTRLNKREIFAFRRKGGDRRCRFLVETGRSLFKTDAGIPLYGPQYRTFSSTGAGLTWPWPADPRPC